MSILIAIVAFAIILVILVVAHELGHFLTAKSRGVGVIEFGVGFPPRIWGIKRGETLYSINALPLGGFVKLAGEEDPKVPRSLASKGYGSRILVLSAGSLMNIILPVVLLTVAFMLPHNVYTAPIVVREIIPGSQAEMAGLRAGDRLISINDTPVRNTGDVQRMTMLNLGNRIELVIERPDSTVETIQLQPLWRPPEGQGATGLGIAYQPAEEYTLVRETLPIWEAVPAGVGSLYDTLRLYKNEIFRWFIGSSSPQFSGIVGMTEVTGYVVRAGISPLIEWASFISINLGIINLLPLPALDGGRIVFVLLEMVRRGRRVSPRVEGLIHAAGFFLLIALMLVITYKDIFNIFTTGSAITP